MLIMYVCVHMYMYIYIYIYICIRIIYTYIYIYIYIQHREKGKYMLVSPDNMILIVYLSMIIDKTKYRNHD